MESGIGSNRRHRLRGRDSGGRDLSLYQHQPRIQTIGRHYSHGRTCNFVGCKRSLHEQLAF